MNRHTAWRITESGLCAKIKLPKSVKMKLSLDLQTRVLCSKIR